MTNTLSMNLSNVREGALKEVYDAVEEAFKALGIDYYLIGAIARDTWYARAKKEPRKTFDVDFAALVGSIAEYEQVKQYLKDHKQYQDTKGNAFVMIAPSGMQVDILPFGEIEIDDGIRLEGKVENPCSLLPVPQITLTHHLQFSMTHLCQIKLIPKKY